MARGEEMKVVDAKTGEDITKRVMTQIILHEEEQKRLNLLPLSFLKKLIQYRDEHLREYFQKYMSLSLDTFMQALEVNGVVITDSSENKKDDEEDQFFLSDPDKEEKEEEDYIKSRTNDNLNTITIEKST